MSSKDVRNAFKARNHTCTLPFEDSGSPGVSLYLFDSLPEFILEIIAL